MFRTGLPGRSNGFPSPKPRKRKAASKACGFRILDKQVSGFQRSTLRSGGSNSRKRIRKSASESRSDKVALSAYTKCGECFQTFTAIGLQKKGARHMGALPLHRFDESTNS
jgi:hypothetical protein